MAITDWPQQLSETGQWVCPLAEQNWVCQVTEATEFCVLWRMGKMKIDGQEKDVGWCGAGGKPEEKYYVGAFVYP